MIPRIAIPQSRSNKPDYVARVMPYYLDAIRLAGGEPVEIVLELDSHQIARTASACDAVLLPGNPADVNPEKYGAERDPHTAADDPLRDNVDELLLQDAYSLRKPILGVCYGLQAINVWRTGTLLQHIATSVCHTNPPGASSPLPEHAVVIDAASKLAEIVRASGTEARGIDWRDVRGEYAKFLEITVNSSHHQAAMRPGDGLRAVAWCRDDGVIEALEGTGDHWLIAVQWHPERMVGEASAQALFRALVKAARRGH